MVKQHVFLGIIITTVLFFGTFQIIDYKEEQRLSHITNLEEKINELQQLNEGLQVDIMNDDVYFGEFQRAKIYPHDNDFSDWKTEWKCYRSEDFTDICVYSNLCYDGKHIIFLNPDLPETSKSLYEYPLKGSEKQVKFDWVYWDPVPFPPPKPDYVPYMSMFSNNDINPYELNPKSILNITDSVEIMNGAMYYVPYEHNNGNLWHVAMQGLNLWESQMLNETLDEKSKLPSMDYIVVETPFMMPGWKRQLHRVISQPHSQFLTLEWFLNQSVFEVPPSQLPESIHSFNPNDFPNNYQDNFSPPPRKFYNSIISKENLVCSREAVILSQKPRLFSTLQSSINFRDAAFGIIGEEAPSKRGKNKISDRPLYGEDFFGKVLIDYRGEGAGRNVVNHEEIVSLVEYYQLEAILSPSFNEFDSYEKQIHALGEVDVYIIVHGAGVTNAMFMAPRSSLIEISPYGMRVPMYKYAAEVMGLFYLNVVSWLKGPIDERKCSGQLHMQAFFDKCEKQSFLKNNLDACNLYAKNACAYVPIYEVEQALISAYDLIGVNINTRVNELYSTKINATSNNYHNKQNFRLVNQGWDFNLNGTPQYVNE